MDDATPAELHDPTGIPAALKFLLTGLPAGLKFDFNPNEEEVLKHLEDKVTGKLHPLIDEFIPTLEEENDICYTHPERLPGVSKDSQIQYFFHRPSKAYSTATRKRRRIHTDEDGSETRWQETGNTQPVLIGGTMKGFKKILVFDTHYERHQYHLGSNYEKEGELVVSKVFYLTQQRQYGSSIKDSTGRKTAELHDPMGIPAGSQFLPMDNEILEYLEHKETGKLLSLIDKLIPTLEEEKDINYTHPERLPGVSKDGQIQYFFHRPGTRKGKRIQTGDGGRETSWCITGNTQPVLIEGTMKGFKKIFVFDGYERHQYHLGNKEVEEGELVISKVFYQTQQQQYGSSIKGSTGRKTGVSFLRGCLNGIKGSLIVPSNAVTKVINFFTGSELQASEQELPHKPDDANYDRESGSYSTIADESIPKRGKLSQSKSDDNEGSLPSTIITPHHSPTPNQTETGGTKAQRMQARITINPGAADMKNAVSRSDKVPPSSLPPVGVQAFGSASCTSLPKPDQPVAFGHLNSASSSGHNFPSSGSGNQAGSFHQMGLSASASSWSNDEQLRLWGSDFTGNLNAAPTLAAQNQNPYWGQVRVNPEIGVGAHPANQNATPRPVGQNQEPGYRRVGIGSVSMNPSFTIRSASSSTIDFDNGNTNTVSAPPCWANYGSKIRNPI